MRVIQAQIYCNYSESFPKKSDEIVTSGGDFGP